MTTRSMSTRKAGHDRVAGHRPHKHVSNVVDMRGTPVNAVADLQGRDLSDESLPHIWAAAAYVKCRGGGHVSSCALVTAIGAGSDGRRRLFGLDAVDTEPYAGRLAFQRSMCERGVGSVMCATADAHEGLMRAIEKVFPAPHGSAASRT